MLLSLLITLLSLIVSVSADNSKQCAKELQGILYYPDICAFQYLKRISKQLRAVSPLLWSSEAEAQAVVKDFEVKYQVNLQFIDALGKASNYPGGPIKTNAIVSGSATMRAIALGEGFVNSDETNHYVYSSIYWFTEGRMYIVKIRLNRMKFSSTYCK